MLPKVRGLGFSAEHSGAVQFFLNLSESSVIQYVNTATSKLRESAEWASMIDSGTVFSHLPYKTLKVFRKNLTKIEIND